MKIVFLHVYSEYNAGDAAIVSVMIDDYRTRFPDATIYLSSITKQLHKEFKDALYISSLFYELVYAKDNWIQRIKRLRYAINKIKEADLVIGVGGGYIIGKPGWKSTISLIITLFEFWICKKIGKKVVLYSQSIGPFHNKFQLLLSKYVLNSLDQITVRESISYHQLKQMKVDAPHIKKAYDAAFYFTARTKTRMKNYLMKHGVFFTKPVLGITVRKCFEDERQKDYEQSIVSCAYTAATEYGYKVVFIPHVTAPDQNDDDRNVQQSIRSHIKPHRDIIYLNDRFTYQELKGIYDNLNLLIGTRMHSVIFSLTGFVPVIGLAYEPKTVGIMKQNQLEKWVLNVEEISKQNLLNLFKRLHKEQKNYKKYLLKAYNYVNNI